MPLISVVIPVYQAEACLEELSIRLLTSFAGWLENFEIVFVEDCSRDDSWAVLKKICKRDARFHAIQLSRNFGQHQAITAGVEESRGEWVVVMDCDLQDPPEAIRKLYEEATRGFEVVVAARKRRKISAFERVRSWLFYRFLNLLSGMDHDWEVGNFRIIHRKVATAYGQFQEQMRFFVGTINWMGFRTSRIEVEHADRFSGESSYNYTKLFRLAFEVILSYSNKPLYFVGWVGFSISLLSFLLGCVFVARYFLYGSPVTGWPSLIVSLFFLGGIIILVLGIIGIYLARVFDEVKARPLFLVRERIGNGSEKSSV